jgi:hypothetical protein
MAGMSDRFQGSRLALKDRLRGLAVSLFSVYVFAIATGNVFPVPERQALVARVYTSGK